MKPQKEKLELTTPLNNIDSKIINKIQQKFKKELLVICDKFCPELNSNKVSHLLYPAQLKLHEFIYQTANSIELESIITNHCSEESNYNKSCLNLYLQREVYNELETLIEEINPKAFSKLKKDTLFIQMQEKMEHTLHKFIKKKYLSM